MCLNEPEHRKQPSLNFDVLRLICNDLANVSDVLSFALTCSTLRKDALKRRLRMSSVVLSGPDSVERFHKFIFADPTSRAPYLSGITLSPKADYAPGGDPHFQNCLVAILEAATRIEHLDFPTTTGDSFCSAVAKITTLQELIVTFCPSSRADDQRKLEALGVLLTALQSPLRYLWIGQGHFSLDFLHSHLSQFAPTLEFLRLGDFHSNTDSFSVSTPFTAMRSLHLASRGQLGFYRLDVLLRLFPNLDDTLSLGGFVPLGVEPEALREESKEVQKAYTWTGLHHVTYNIDLAFTMALQCPIRCMKIEGPGLQGAEAGYLKEILRDNCPQKLTLSIRLPDPQNLRVLDGLFPPKDADRLTHLVLFFEITVDQDRLRSGQWYDVWWGEFMDALVNSVKHLRSLAHLRLVLYYYDFDPLVFFLWSNPSQSEQNASTGTDSDETFVQDVAHDVDVDLYPTATRLLGLFPALECVLLKICRDVPEGEPWTHWNSARAWHVQEAVLDSEDPRGDPLDEIQRGGAGSRSCVEISGEAARAVIDEEELHLGQREEGQVSRLERLPTSQLDSAPGNAFDSVMSS